jgi:hypothetical protein
MGLYILHLNIQRFFYHCILLNVSMERIAREGDHVLRGYLEFFFDEDIVRLKPDPDLEILDRVGFGLNPPLMDWFSAWMQNDAPPGTIICKTEFAISLRSLTDRTSALHALKCFYREHSLLHWKVVVIFKGYVGENPGLGKWCKLYGSVMVVPTVVLLEVAECCRHVPCPTVVVR